MRRARAQSLVAVPIGDGATVTGGYLCLFGRPRSFDGALRDQLITLARTASLGLEAVRLQEQLRALATRDALTGLDNRAAIDEAVTRALEEDQAAGVPTSLLFLDVDGFKTVNDEWGHRAGDVVLQRFADRIRSCVRPADRVGRYGGDEFLVLCRGADGREAGEIARRILDRLHEPLAELAEVRVTASIGVVTAAPGDPGAVVAENLIRRADSGMYSAKREGKDRIAGG